jgi:hypothetical protein
MAHMIIVKNIEIPNRSLLSRPNDRRISPTITRKNFVNGATPHVITRLSSDVKPAF